jgi:hypothetical protein
MLRATQTAFPAAKDAQLGADISCPPTVVSGLHDVPLNFATTSALVVLRAPQNTFPNPSSVQLGLEVMTPAMLFQPLHVLPLNSFTSIVWLRPRAAQTAFPWSSGVQDGSPIMTVVPIDTKPLQLAHAELGGSKQTARTSQ